MSEIGTLGGSLRAQSGADPPVGFTQRLGFVQRTLGVRKSERLSEIPEREARRREFDLRVAGLRDAAHTLAGTAPQAEFTSSLHAREVETKRRVDDEEFAAIVEEFAQAFGSLRALLDEEGLGARSSSRTGLLEGDERAGAVAEALDRIASELGQRASGSGSTLRDVGLSLESDGTLSLDRDRLQVAVASDATSVVELLNNSSGGLGRDVADSLTLEDPGALDVGGSLTGFLSALTARETQLDRRVELLENVVMALSRQSSGLTG